jgi:hypothetical protein
MHRCLSLCLCYCPAHARMCDCARMHRCRLSSFLCLCRPVSRVSRVSCCYSMRTVAALYCTVARAGWRCICIINVNVKYATKNRAAHTCGAGRWLLYAIRGRPGPGAGAGGRDSSRRPRVSHLFFSSHIIYAHKIVFILSGYCGSLASGRRLMQVPARARAELSSAVVGSSHSHSHVT